jgi:hypothetical protein
MGARRLLYGLHVSWTSSIRKAQIKFIPLFWTSELCGVVKAEMEATIVIAVEREASIFNVDEAERNYQGPRKGFLGIASSLYYPGEI